ncbi:putative manganese efflux pump MntP [Halomonas elongata]|uniref:Putative manganese efflux pump MntP n=1 Tax=Halomonas elongata TaxID=2746 RepID=A0A1B8P305_HALEL|nr:manganese efflux pump MntP family protein [Halomonas elongata]OBX36627.1 putative manganese efflux pump MntP [Halomonas elongata]
MAFHPGSRSQHVPLLDNFSRLFHVQRCLRGFVEQGAALPARPSLRQALRTGLVFSIIETLTPLLGWTLGLSMAQYVAAWDHWIAFGLLSLLGAHMIHEGLQNEEADATPRRSAPRSFVW